MLWVALRCFQKQEPDSVAVVYTGDAVLTKGEDILAKVEVRSRQPSLLTNALADGATILTLMLYSNASGSRWTCPGSCSSRSGAGSSSRSPPGRGSR